MQTESYVYPGGLTKELFTEIDWELFLQLARHHRIYHLIYTKLSKVYEKLIPSKNRKYMMTEKIRINSKGTYL